MGYGTIYADRTVSHLTEREVSFLDRLFSKALVSTPFGRKFRQNRDAGNDFLLRGKDIERYDGAQAFYQQTGLYFFGDNEFAFRTFEDTRENSFSLERLGKAQLLIPSPMVCQRLPEAIDKALIEIESRDNSDYKSGAWQIYRTAQSLVPIILPNIRDKRTIQRKL